MLQNKFIYLNAVVNFIKISLALIALLSASGCIKSKMETNPLEITVKETNDGSNSETGTNSGTNTNSVFDIEFGFNKNINPDSVDKSTVKVKDSSGNLISPNDYAVSVQKDKILVKLNNDKYKGQEIKVELNGVKDVFDKPINTEKK